jgi:ribosomal protein S18 acetylase RimI-like enzyme
MLFATASLARRIEAAECRLTVEAAEIAARRRNDVLVAPIGGGAAVYTGPGEPFNKMLGLGFEPSVDPEALAAIERKFAERGAPLQVELATLANGEVAALLARRGYHLANFENVLALALSPAVVADAERRVQEAAREGIEISAAVENEVPSWIDVVVTGFAHPDTFDGPASHESFPRELLERVFGDQKGAPGFRQFLAARAGVVAGGGSMRVDDGLAQLCGSATLPAHRRQGVQSTLLRARLLEAARAGCDLAVVTTQPGSKSQENVQRAGFALLYARAIMIKEADAGI